jgi:hypothetical protein
VAVGAIVGGQIINAEVFGPVNTWRFLFVGEGLLMLPLCIGLCLIKGPSSIRELSENEDDQGSAAGDGSFKDAVQRITALVTNFDYVMIVLGNTPLLFLVAALAYGCRSFLFLTVAV